LLGSLDLFSVDELSSVLFVRAPLWSPEKRGKHGAYPYIDTSFRLKLNHYQELERSGFINSLYKG